MKDIVIIAPQGAGKTTQAELLAFHYEMQHLRMSCVLREYADTFQDVDLQKELRRSVIISREKCQKALEYALSQVDLFSGVVFDGFPRRSDHIPVMDLLHKKFNIGVSHIFCIQLDEAICVSRLLNRRICPKCNAVYNKLLDPVSKCKKCEVDLVKRSDDTPKSIRQRIQYFHELTQPLLRCYSDRIIMIDGNSTPKAVFRQIQFHLR